MEMPFVSPPHAPFVLLTGRIMNGPPVRVLLDTGNVAPFEVMIAPAAAARAGIAVGAEEGALSGLAGAVNRANPVILPSFTLGPICLSSPSAAVLPALVQVGEKVGSPIDAMVGGAFLEGRMVSICYATKVVDFAPATPGGRPLPVHFAAKRPLILVTARVNGEGPFDFALDTASSHTLLSPSAARRAGLTSSSVVTATGAGGDIAVGVANGRITFGPHDRKVPLFVTAAVDQIGDAGGASLDGILGADVFGLGTLTLDYAGRRIWMEAGDRRP
jgi:predicted aspartyl protease